MKISNKEKVLIIHVSNREPFHVDCAATLGTVSWTCVHTSYMNLLAMPIRPPEELPI